MQPKVPACGNKASRLRQPKVPTDGQIPIHFNYISGVCKKTMNTNNKSQDYSLKETEQKVTTILGINSIKILFALEYVLQGLANPFLGITYQPFYNHMRYYYGLNEALIQSYVSRIYLAWSFKPVIGFFMDAYGKTRITLMLLLLSGTVLYFLTPFFNISVNVFFCIMFVISILFACTDVAVDRATVIEGDEEARNSGKSKATAVGLNQAICWAAIYLTSIFSACSGGWIAENVNIKYLFIFLAIVPFTVFLVALKLPVDKKASIPLKSSVKNFWDGLNTGPVLWVILFYFLFKFQPSLGSIWLFHLIENLHYSQTQIGFCEAFNHGGHFLGILFFVFSVVKWQEKVGFRNLFRVYIFLSIILNLIQYLLVEPVFGRFTAGLHGLIPVFSIEMVKMIYLSIYNIFSGFISAIILMSTMSLVGSVIPVEAAGSLFAGFMSVANLARSFSYASGSWLYTEGLNYGIFSYLQERIFSLSASPGDKMSINLLIFIGSISYLLSFLAVHMLPHKKDAQVSEDITGPECHRLRDKKTLKAVGIFTFASGLILFSLFMYIWRDVIQSVICAFFIPVFIRKLFLDMSCKK